MTTINIENLNNHLEKHENENQIRLQNDEIIIAANNE